MEKLVKNIVFIVLLISSIKLVSREPQYLVKSNSEQDFSFKASNCDAPKSRVDLDINNVRATILSGGDMWWDLNAAQYEVPKGSNKHSLFAGSLWVGGVDETNNLKIAAMTYRQAGVDFWPGPINQNNLSSDKATCSEYDKHFKINRQEVEDYVTAFNKGESPEVPLCMLNYPAHGNQALGHDFNLAPFHDVDGDLSYNPLKGDYPDYGLDNNSCDAELFGDETLWWIFNDVGNIHTETGANALGLEVHAQAFGFQTNDEINDMTFYNYKIINRSTFEINNTFFGVWVDPDLGNFNDDYVGCDVERGLGYCYNGDQNDETEKGYGLDPPAVGVDFFQGPKADDGDGIDNDRDGTIDEVDEKIIMSKFVYYNNDATEQGNPSTGIEFYNYLQGIWLDNTPMMYGGNGKGSGAGSTQIECDFMFPGSSDLTKNWGTGGTPQVTWDEVTAGNSPADRRFIQSAGPFTLKVGEVNTITTGVVWARGAAGSGTAGSIERLKAADDKAQALFDNCFKVLDGPDAPDLVVQELKNEVILILENSGNSNNANEDYEEKDPIIPIDGNNYDTTFNFQGYQVFQLANATVSASELNDPAKARLVLQSDLEDGVSKIVNHIYDNEIGFTVPSVMVNGVDEGLKHSISIKKDLFAEGDDRLINEKSYYFMAISYAHNDFLSYTGSSDSKGQQKPYLAGRRNILVYEAVPHDAGIEGNGTIINANYGISPEISRVAGKGSSDKFVNLSKSTLDKILNPPYKVDTPVFNIHGAPVGVTVVDPLLIPKGNFKIELLDSITPGDLRDAYWRAIHLEENDTVYSIKTISSAYDQVVKKWGMSFNITQSDTGGYVGSEKFGIIGDSIVFEDPTKPWFEAVKDEDGNTPANWIRAGVQNENGSKLYGDKCNVSAGLSDCTEFTDKEEYFEKIMGGIAAPFFMTSNENYGPNSASGSYFGTGCPLNQLNNVDIVFTDDKSLWTICPVVEMADGKLGEGSVEKLDLRVGTTVDMNGETLPAGLGVFPGYVIDVTTGERMNMMFGENSFYEAENGKDMLWNPTYTEFTELNQPLFGGFHSIFIFTSKTTYFNPVYDKGKELHSYLPNSTFSKNNVYNSVSWVIPFPKINPAYGALATKTTLKLRINQIYEEENSTLPVFEFNTDSIVAKENDNETAKANLDKVNVVPNPYYAFSEYEASKFERGVKITNLPQTCKIKIFTLNGTLVRTINKDDSNSSRESTAYLWDLKNNAGVPIGSGLYIFHIEAEGIGTKVIKWFGVMRQDDIETY